MVIIIIIKRLYRARSPTAKSQTSRQANLSLCYMQYSRASLKISGHYHFQAPPKRRIWQVLNGRPTSPRPLLKDQGSAGKSMWQVVYSKHLHPSQIFMQKFLKKFNAKPLISTPFKISSFSASQHPKVPENIPGN